jgi:hypothetical protein
MMGFCRYTLGEAYMSLELRSVFMRKNLGRHIRTV